MFTLYVDFKAGLPNPNFRNQEFFVKNQEFFVKNQEFFVKNQEFFVKNQEFFVKNQELIGRLFLGNQKKNQEVFSMQRRQSGDFFKKSGGTSEGFLKSG